MEYVRADSVRNLYTIGPQGTNCELAASHWLTSHGIVGRITLHDTLEDAAESALLDEAGALLTPIAYPHLHSIIYKHLSDLTLVDLFLMPTHALVLASRTGKMPAFCSTHPSPAELVPPGIQRRLAGSTAQAARDCVAGISDGCITTAIVAKRAGLTIVKDFGQIIMGFCLHARMKMTGTE